MLGLLCIKNYIFASSLFIMVPLYADYFVDSSDPHHLNESVAVGWRKSALIPRLVVIKT